MFGENVSQLESRYRTFRLVPLQSVFARKAD
jgi:hypothetical protein